VRRLPLALLLALGVVGCGGNDPLPPDPPAVRLTVTSPSDASTVKEDSVEISGRVAPARASVLVMGKAAPVAGGEFSADVSLDEGANVIDVSASMPGRSAAFAALRVTYDPRVTIPDLKGVTDEEAAGRIEGLGLDSSLQAVGGLFDELRSGARKVCESDPPAGSTVDPGTGVTLKTAKRC
jgi:Glucodextranase, domain B/PASTA domain